MPYDSRGPNPFLELDVLNQRWQDLALAHRDASSRDRKRLEAEMIWQEDLYRAAFAKVETALNEYRPKVPRFVSQQIEIVAFRNLDKALSDAQQALGSHVLRVGGKTTLGGLYDLADSTFNLIELLRRALHK